MIGSRPPGYWVTVGLVDAVFLVPPATIWIWMIAREFRRTRAALESLKQEMEASAAEGFPPPGPPTTDSLPDDVAD